MHPLVTFFFVFLVLGVFCFFASPNPRGPLMAISTTCAICAFFVAGLAFIAPIDAINTETKDFRIEKTRYRVIITAFGKETTYTDALTVSKADHIVAIRRSTPLNAWGIEMSSCSVLSPVFSRAD